MPDWATSARNKVESLSFASTVIVSVTSWVSAATCCALERTFNCVCGLTLVVKTIGAFGDSNDKSFT